MLNDKLYRVAKKYSKDTSCKVWVWVNKNGLWEWGFDFPSNYLEIIFKIINGEDSHE